MAALTNTCLDGVLGLANCECPCLTDTAPADYNDSTSGLYLTDLVPMNLVDGADRCTDPGNPWNMLDRARTQGANMVLADVRAGIMKRNQTARPNYTGMIGEKTARAVRNLSTTYAGVRISAPRIKGGYMRVTRIGGIFDATGSVSVRIYDRFNQTHGAAVVIATTAGAYASTACDITLPLWCDGAEWPEYWAVYTVNQSNLPRENRIYCPTCSKNALPTFSLLAPYYGKKWGGPQGWANWVMVGGWGGDSLTEFDIEAETNDASNYMNGLTVTGEFYCDSLSSICLDGLDFTDPVALSLAHAYRYASAITLAQMLIRSPEVMRNAMVAKEVLAVDLKEWWTDYQKNVEYVAYNAPVKNSDCIYCKPTFSMSVQSKLP